MASQKIKGWNKPSVSIKYDEFGKRYFPLAISSAVSMVGEESTGHLDVNTIEKIIGDNLELGWYGAGIQDLFILLDASDREAEERAFEEQIIYDKQNKKVEIYHHLDFDIVLKAKGNFAEIQEIVTVGVLNALKKFNITCKIEGFDFDTFYNDLKELLRIEHVLSLAA